MVEECSGLGSEPPLSDRLFFETENPDRLAVCRGDILIPFQFDIILLLSFALAVLRIGL
jgi:hypothetical protein